MKGTMYGMNKKKFSPVTGGVAPESNRPQRRPAPSADKLMVKKESFGPMVAKLNPKGPLPISEGPLASRLPGFKGVSADSAQNTMQQAVAQKSSPEAMLRKRAIRSLRGA